MIRSVLIVLFILSMPLPILGSGWRVYRHNEKAIDAYDRGETAEAVESLSEALIEAPHNGVLHHNRGNVHFQNGDYDQAKVSFERAQDLLSEDHPGIHYNLGNTHFQLGDYKKAIESYTKALQLRPNDRDTKQNLEKVLYMMEQRVSPNQQSQDDSDDSEDSEDEQQQQGQAAGSPSQDQADKERDQAMQKQEEEADEKQRQVEQFMNGLEQDDQEMRRKYMKQPESNASSVDKDW